MNSTGLGALTALDETQAAAFDPLSMISDESPASSDLLQPADHEKTSPPGSIAAELQQIFRQKSVKSDHRGFRVSEVRANVNHMRSGLSITDQDRDTDSFRPMAYDDFISLLPQEIVESLVLRFGSLGCDQIGATRTRYLVQSLEQDKTTSVFDRIIDFSTPLSDCRQHRTQQMLEIWFSHHPLSFLVSKTLLLQEVRDGQYEEILLAVMLADVKCGQEDDRARAEGEAMFTWASAQLYRRIWGAGSISVAQALMLLGWHQLCASQPRRAMCYFEWVATVAPALQVPELGLHRINGVDIAHVVLELKHNICWFAFCVMLWAVMQIDSPTPEVLPSTALTDRPPTTEPQSAVLKLDVLSDNLSTLSSQRQAFRRLWRLCHLSSTVAHIYALYPQRKDVDDLLLSTCWQKRTIHQLRNLSTPVSDLPTLCARIRTVLLDTLELVKLHVEDRTSQAIVITAYHTMAIHFLFPCSEDSHASVPLTDAVVDSFCNSAESILGVYHALEHDSGEGRTMVMAVRSCRDASTLALGLDACARAMDSLRKGFEAASQAENKRLQERRGDLLRVANELHAYTKHSRILHAAHMGVIRKQLKIAIRSLDAPTADAIPPDEPSRPEDNMLDYELGNKGSRNVPAPRTSYLPTPSEATLDNDEMMALVAGPDDSGLHRTSHALVAEFSGQLNEQWCNNNLSWEEPRQRPSRNDGGGPEKWHLDMSLSEIQMSRDARTGGVGWVESNGSNLPWNDSFNL